MSSTPAFRWRDTFLLGYPPMDATHREFVACVEAILHGSDAAMAGHVQALAAHCTAHFAEEDAWMDDTGFPPAACHKDEHGKVLASVQEVAALVAAGDFAVGRRLAAALADWFPGHADYMDAALAQWMSKRAFGGAPVVLRRADKPL